MKRLLIILLFLVASVWIGLEILKDPGYLLLVYSSWMVQMPLWFAVLAAFIFLGLFYLLITSLDWVQLSWFRFKNWLKLRGEYKAYSKTQHGLALLVEGRYKKAETLLQAGVNQSKEPLMNYLGSAKAAHELGAFDRRDRYFNQAYKVAPDAAVAIGLVKAECAMSENKWEQAAAILTHLRTLSSRHPNVLKKLEKVYVHLADWKQLMELLPSLKKARLLTSEQIELFEKNLYAELIDSANRKSLSELQGIWYDVPRHVRKYPEVLLAYVTQLSRFNEAKDEIVNLVKKYIRYSWQPELVRVYSKLHFNDWEDQLVVVGSWLKLYGDKQEILCLLGKICSRIQLWGRAKDYFERTLQHGPCREASYEYGKLLESIGEEKEAMRVYREGLA